MMREDDIVFLLISLLCVFATLWKVVSYSISVGWNRLHCAMLLRV